MDEAELTRRRGWKLTLALAVSTLLSVAAFGPLLLALALAPTLFDSPGSDERVLPWVLFVLVVATPVVCLVSATGGWLAYIFRHRRTAWLFALLPLPFLAAYALLLGVPLFGHSEPLIGAASFG